jgi:hypothetical protein
VSGRQLRIPRMRITQAAGEFPASGGDVYRPKVRSMSSRARAGSTRFARWHGVVSARTRAGSYQSRYVL